MAEIEVFAPARADLAGGTLDLWPLYCFHPGSVTVNVALAVGVRLRLLVGGAPKGTILHLAPGQPARELQEHDRHRDLVAAVGFHFCREGGFAVDVSEQPPVCSGLGGSSTFAVALARACLVATGKRLQARVLVHELRDLEAGILQVPTGVQDYYPALLGGPLAIRFAPGGEAVERIGVDTSWLAARVLVFYSGITHASGMVNWDVYRARVDGDPGVTSCLSSIAEAAEACARGLSAGDERAVAEAIAAEWSARRHLAPAVSTPELESLIDAGLSAGAHAGKACGAGGGGSVVFWLPPSRRVQVRAALKAVARRGAAELAGGVRRRVRAPRHLA
jgi:D-glycero-alpha-D-manno-heptose-7-phosphate kinase